jgi:hypothetical protein
VSGTVQYDRIAGRACQVKGGHSEVKAMVSLSVYRATRAFGSWKSGLSRSMGSSASSSGVTYAGVTVQPPSLTHRVLSELLGGMMFSWLFIRMYEDGEGMLFGHTEHLDHDLHALQHGSEGH